MILGAGGGRPSDDWPSLGRTRGQRARLMWANLFVHAQGPLKIHCFQSLTSANNAKSLFFPHSCATENYSHCENRLGGGRRQRFSGALREWKRTSGRKFTEPKVSACKTIFVSL